MFDDEGAWLVAWSGSVVGTQLYVQPEALSTPGKQVMVGKTDELAWQLAARDGKTELGPYTGRLAGGQRDTRQPGAQILYST